MITINTIVLKLLLELFNSYFLFILIYKSALT